MDSIDILLAVMAACFAGYSLTDNANRTSVDRS